APQVLAGNVEPAIAAVVILLQLALVEPYAATTTAVRQYPALRLVLDRISESGVLDPDGGVESGGLVSIPVRPGGKAGVELQGLSAAWPGSPPVFSGLTAMAEPGRWLAVTGASGSGKSTLLAVLLGFLPARAGRVAVTGRAAWCPQEAHLFDSTIRGNLMLGRPAMQGAPEDISPKDEDPGNDASRQMENALAAVGLDRLLARLQDGLDTRIGPGGAFLSGGERQRLAVARTLMTGADVILLDEPTAHLDAASGAAMLSDLRRGLRGRTVVLVTHNPADLDPTDLRLNLDEESVDGNSVANLDGSGGRTRMPGAAGLLVPGAGRV
ncbi:MAG: ATP-binding cassette domain-containing protein, partial [Arthrobacter sp.]